MLFLFTRVGSVEQKSGYTPNASLSMSQASSRELKKTKSSPILRKNGIASTADRAPSTHPSATAPPKLAVEVTEVSPASAFLNPSYYPDQTNNKHGSLTSKIRYRLSSFNRASGSQLVQQDFFPARTDQPRTPDPKAIRSYRINSAYVVSQAEENPPIFQDNAKAMPAWNTRHRSKSVIESKPPLHSCSMSFFKDGLAKAHKFLGRAFEGFSDRDSEEKVGDDCHDDEEEDLNRLYSNEMVPLEFPNEGDGETTYSPSSPFEQEWNQDRQNIVHGEDINPEYCIRKQSSSCLPNRDQFLALQNGLRPSSLFATISSQLPSNGKNESVLPRKLDVKLRLI